MQKPWRRRPFHGVWSQGGFFKFSAFFIRRTSGHAFWLTVASLVSKGTLIPKQSTIFFMFMLAIYRKNIQLFRSRDKRILRVHYFFFIPTTCAIRILIHFKKGNVGLIRYESVLRVAL